MGQWPAISDFGSRISFGLRISTFGFDGHERTRRRKDRATDTASARGCAEEGPDRPQPGGADRVRAARRPGGAGLRRPGNLEASRRRDGGLARPSARHADHGSMRCRVTAIGGRAGPAEVRRPRWCSPPPWPACWPAPSRTASTPLPKRSRRIGTGSIRSKDFKRLFSVQTLVPTAISITKLAVIIALTYSEVRSVLNDPIFTTSVSVSRMASFLAADEPADLPAGQPGAAGDRRGGLRLSMVAHAARPDDDPGRVEGGNEEHRRQSADQKRPPPPPRREQDARCWPTCPRPMWW